MSALQLRFTALQSNFSTIEKGLTRVVVKEEVRLYSPNKWLLTDLSSDRQQQVPTSLLLLLLLLLFSVG